MSKLYRIKHPIVNLLDGSDGGLDRQLLFGEGFSVLSIKDGWAIGRRATDNYSGYIQASDLANWAEPTHRVSSFGAHVYSTPDIKTIPMMHLPFQSELTVVGEVGQFAELDSGGYIHQLHIEALTVLETDPLLTAERFLGVPYLWGGNSQYGIDCSGLVSAAMKSVGIECPADSGDQEASFGQILEHSSSYLRGDLVFWKGHVGLMASPDLLLHANGYHMKVVCEPLAVAEKRILVIGGGAVTSRKRVVV